MEKKNTAMSALTFTNTHECKAADLIPFTNARYKAHVTSAKDAQTSS